MYRRSSICVKQSVQIIVVLPIITILTVRLVFGGLAMFLKKQYSSGADSVVSCRNNYNYIYNYVYMYIVIIVIKLIMTL